MLFLVTLVLNLISQWVVNKFRSNTNEHTQYPPTRKAMLYSTLRKSYLTATIWQSSSWFL